MGPDSFQVLLIEDNPLDACVIREYLDASDPNGLHLKHVDRLSAGLARLAGDRFDAVLLDLNLPDSSGMDTVVQVHRCTPHVPIVVLTGADPREFGVDALKAGAEDYLAKEDLNPNLLVRTIRYAIERAGHRRADQQYQEEAARYRQLLGAVTSYTYSVTFGNGVPVSSRHTLGCLSATGYTPEEYASDPYLWFRMIHRDDRDMVRRYLAEVHAGKKVAPIEHRILHKDGRTRWIRNTVIQRHDQDGSLLGYDGVVEDISERRQAEEALRDRSAHLLAAQEIQRRLWPVAAPGLSGFDIAGASYPAEFAAGDYFDYLSMPDGSLGLVIGDVAGHGLGPSIVMALTYAHLRSLAHVYDSIGDILVHLNQFLLNETDHFVTLLFARLTPADRSIVAVNAGHPPGYVFDSSGRIKAQIGSTSLPLAVLPGAEFPACDPITLEPGDAMLLFTDGIPEARSPAGAQFGVARMLDVVAANRQRPAQEIIEAIYRAVRDFCWPGEPIDDVTAIVINVLVEGAIFSERADP